MSEGEEKKDQYILIPRREFLFFSLCAIVLFASFIISDCVQSRADRAMRKELADKKRALRRESLELEKEQWRKQQGKRNNP